MHNRRASLVCLTLLALAGCATDRSDYQATKPIDVSPIRIGAGDRLGMDLARTDHAIAGAEAHDRALASHPDD